MHYGMLVALILQANTYGGLEMQQNNRNVEAKLICPECSATIISMMPEALIWEKCPCCSKHIWDKYDLLMAETVLRKNGSP